MMAGPTGIDNVLALIHPPDRRCCMNCRSRWVGKSAWALEFVTSNHFFLSFASIGSPPSIIVDEFYACTGQIISNQSESSRIAQVTGQRATVEINPPRRTAILRRSRWMPPANQLEQKRAILT